MIGVTRRQKFLGARIDPFNKLFSRLQSEVNNLRDTHPESSDIVFQGLRQFIARARSLHVDPSICIPEGDREESSTTSQVLPKID